MILNIKQTQFGAEPEFEIEDTATGETLAKCTSLNHISTEIVFAGQNAYTLSFEPVLQEREGEKNELMYSILEHNRPVGGLYTAEVCQKRILFVLTRSKNAASNFEFSSLLKERYSSLMALSAISSLLLYSRPSINSAAIQAISRYCAFSRYTV